MFQGVANRFGHYAILLLLTAVLCFPNLGAASLWDIDEGNNAEAAREMLESANWIVPTFNYKLRVDKPALLYWLQIFSYRAFGVNEFSARLPSALAALLTVLVAYELGRRLFSPSTGLLSGVVLATTVAFGASAHFANPDALLNFMTALTFLIFWWGLSTETRWWLLLAGITTGLATLAKGPVGVVLPSGVIFLFLLWSRRLSILWDRRLIYGFLLFLAVAAPWYVWVTVDTKANFIRGFIVDHNLGRYLSPMENHNGPIYYYLIALVIGLVPWSVFLWPAIRSALGSRAREDCAPTVGQNSNPDRIANVGQDSIPDRSHVFGARVISCLSPQSDVNASFRYRFLWTWIAVYFVFFSLAGTKLPNYILPIYAPVAILISRCLDRWRTQAIAFPAWRFKLALAVLIVIGAGFALAAVLISADVALPLVYRGQFHHAQQFAMLGLPLMCGSTAAWWCFARGYRRCLIGALAATAACFVGPLFVWADPTLNDMKAPRELIEQSQARRLDREIRIGCFDYFQPSLVFYSGREVRQLATESDVQNFLRSPLETYLFVPKATWEQLAANAPHSARPIAGHMDVFRRCEVVVVRNR
jgi:4-amino-4-deoxy-L-arabinose transferase-like glycosyltransferase